MSDKFRTTQPLKISFAKGEQPSAGKLTAMAEQPRLGNALLEKAVGDLWNQSGDPVLSFAPLQIANLARTVGAAKYLNPALYPVSSDFRFTEELGVNNPGRTTGYLKFPPKVPATILVDPITPTYNIVQYKEGVTTGDADTFVTAIFDSPIDPVNNTIIAIASWHSGAPVLSGIGGTGITMTTISSSSKTIAGSSDEHYLTVAKGSFATPSVFGNDMGFLLLDTAGTYGRGATFVVLEIEGLWTLLDPVEHFTTAIATNVASFGPGTTPISLQTNNATLGVISVVPATTDPLNGVEYLSTLSTGSQIVQIDTTGSTKDMWTAVVKDTVPGNGSTHSFTMAWDPGAGTNDSFIGIDVMMRQVQDRFLTSVTNESDVDAAGEYWIDTETGRFRTYDPLFREDRLTYDVALSEDYMRGQELLPSIIPDPDQDTFTGCRISTNGGKFYLHLPPRRPVRDGTNAIHDTLPRNYPSSDEETLNEQSSSGAGAPFKLWSSSTAALRGASDEHYRYFLPKEIQDRFSSMTNGEVIPAGFVYLWDEGTGTVIEDVVFKKTTVDANLLQTVFEVSSNSFDFSLIASGDTLTGSELPASYNDTNLILITCGSPLSRSVWRLTQMMYDHEHNSAWSLDTPIDHRSLANNDLYPIASPNQTTAYPTYLPDWTGSTWKGDPHLSSLSRAGAQATVGLERDLYNNAMLGHLLLANADESGAKNFLDATLPDASFKLFFGNTTGPSLSATSTGPLMSSTAGYALKLSADVTSPVRAALNILPQDTDPSTPAKGDVYINATSGTSSIYNGTEWTRLVGKVHSKISSTELLGSTGPFTDTYTIPANTLRVGSVINIKAGGFVSSNASGGTVRIDIKVNDVILSTTTRTIQTLDTWYMQSTGTVWTLGVPGTIAWIGNSTFGPSTGIASKAQLGDSGSVDTTANIVVSVELFLSISGASNLVGLASFIVEISD